MNELDARSLEDLRALGSSDLLEAQNLLGEHAQSLGYPDLMTFLEMPPPSRTAFRAAGKSGKPLMHGTTRNEYHLFTALTGGGPDSGRRLATNLFSGMDLTPEDLDTLVSLLQSQHPDREEDDLHADVLTAALMDYPHGILARTYGADGAQIYRYHFTMTSPEFPELGAFHALDLPYFFGTLEAPSSAQLVGESPSVELSEHMMDAITSFARSGRPTTSAGPEWPPWTDGKRAVMQFGESTELVHDPMPWMDEFTAAFETMLEGETDS
jgi:para-nitrobenzyl esterase